MKHGIFFRNEPLHLFPVLVTLVSNLCSPRLSLSDFNLNIVWLTIRNALNLSTTSFCFWSCSSSGWASWTRSLMLLTFFPSIYMETKEWRIYSLSLWINMIEYWHGVSAFARRFLTDSQGSLFKQEFRFWWSIAYLVWMEAQAGLRDDTQFSVRVGSK